jgi:hypothetical protein
MPHSLISAGFFPGLAKSATLNSAISLKNSKKHDSFISAEEYASIIIYPHGLARPASKSFFVKTIHSVVSMLDCQVLWQVASTMPVKALWSEGLHFTLTFGFSITPVTSSLTAA